MPPGHDLQELQNVLIKAAAAGESLLQRAGSGTGEALRANFLLVAEMVEREDGHLLRKPEHTFLTSFQVNYFLVFMRSCGTGWQSLHQFPWHPVLSTGGFVYIVYGNCH